MSVLFVLIGSRFLGTASSHVLPQGTMTWWLKRVTYLTWTLLTSTRTSILFICSCIRSFILPLLLFISRHTITLSTFYSSCIVYLGSHSTATVKTLQASCSWSSITKLNWSSVWLLELFTLLLYLTLLTLPYLVFTLLWTRQSLQAF